MYTKIHGLSSMLFLSITIVLLLSFGLTAVAFAASPILDRIEIDDDDISSVIAADDEFGYEILRKYR